MTSETKGEKLKEKWGETSDRQAVLVLTTKGDKKGMAKYKKKEKRQNRRK